MIIHPNIAILDQWLPVILELKKTEKNIKVFGLFIKDIEASKVRNNDILNNIANELLDGVITMPGDKDMYFKKKYFSALSIQNIKNSTFNNLSLSSFLIRVFFKVFSLFFNIIFKSINKKNKINSLSFAHISVFTDITCFWDKKFSKIIDIIPVNEIYCLPHGSGVGEQQLSNNLPDNIKKINFKVFTSSKSNKLKLIENLNLNPLNIIISGLPKYSKSWINYIIQSKFSKVIPSKFIYITSRPVSHYFTFDEKYQIITDCIEIALRFNLSIIFRPHPKEFSSEIQKMIHKITNNDKLNWSYDPLTAVATSKKALFAVHMSNTMPMDTAFVGTPSITYRPLNSRLHYPFGLTDLEGVNISIPENDGYSFQCYNGQQFKKLSESIIYNRDSVGLTQKLAFEGKNHISDNASKVIKAQYINDTINLG